MDMQLNIGNRAMSYLSKYISKPTEVIRGTLVNEQDDEAVSGFYYHRLSLPEVVMDIFSHNVSRLSSAVKFLPTQQPKNRKRLLKKASVLREQLPDSQDIFAHDLWKKYLLRPEGLLFEHMSYVEFYGAFHQVFAPGPDDGYQPPYDEAEPDRERTYRDISDPPRLYKAYENQHEALVRHRGRLLPTRLDWLHATQSDSFSEMAANYLSDENLERVASLSMVAPQQQDRALALALMPVLNEEQRAILDRVSGMPGHYVITRPAGSGKSTVLGALCQSLTDGQQYHPIALAPTGVAAVNIGGQTIHQFFGARPKHGEGQDFVVDLYTLDWNLHVIRASGRLPYFILDEASMLSTSMLDDLSHALQSISHDRGHESSGIL
ncbi:hypothetical protein BGZ98_005236 [Dissophora globulifera]|nr:hypothetical protein BGZ98_005236 [Dissophora globulifera]